VDTDNKDDPQEVFMLLLLKEMIRLNIKKQTGMLIKYCHICGNFYEKDEEYTHGHLSYVM
jgi:hypothetical protein